MGEENRPRVWVLYGWFSGLMCVGSVFGAVAWAAWLQFLVAEFTGYFPGTTYAQLQSLNAQAQYWRAAFYVIYAIEFLCLSVAKLLVLDRMAEFAVPKGDGWRRRLAGGSRAVMAAVVVGNVAGLCSNVAAAVLAKQSADFYSAAGAAFSANNTDSGSNLFNLANQKDAVSDDISSVQQFCEVAVLLIIILAFAVVGIAGARRVSSALHVLKDEQGAPGRQLRRQIVGTAAFVFVTFLLRAVFSIMNALANALQNNGSDCATTDVNPCDTTCFNVYAVIQAWLQYAPEFQMIVTRISSPLALLVALWGMTSERALQQMEFSRRQMQMVTVGDSVALRTK